MSQLQFHLLLPLPVPFRISLHPDLPPFCLSAENRSLRDYNIIDIIKHRNVGIDKTIKQKETSTIKGIRKS